VVNLENIILIYGDEEFFVEENLSKIKNKFSTDSIIKLDMLQLNIENIIDEAGTYDLFNSNKLVICDNCIFLTASKKASNYDTQKLLDYLQNSNELNTIIFVVREEKLDERKKIVKFIRENAKAIECNHLLDNDLKKYVKDKFSDNGYNISNAAIDKFVKYVGNNLFIIEKEIEKMLIYKIQEKDITEKDIEDITSKILKSDVFELVNAVLKRDYKQIFELYNDLILLGEEPIKILVMLSNQFRLIYQVKVLNSNGMSEKDIASKLGVHPYRVKLAKESNVNKNDSLKYIDELAKLDINIKTGKIDKNIGLELFFLQL